MSAEIKGEVLGEWEINAVMGGDEPGMIQLEYPLLAQDLIRQIEEEDALGLIPKGKRRGILIDGPLLKNGRKIKVIYKLEYPEENWR